MAAMYYDEAMVAKLAAEVVESSRREAHKRADVRELAEAAYRAHRDLIPGVPPWLELADEQRADWLDAAVESAMVTTADG